MCKLGVVRETLLLAVLLLAFATWVTVHVAISVRLFLAGPPRHRGLLALFLPPLAPLPIDGAYALDSHGSVLWVAAVVVYALVRALAAA